MPEIVFNRPQIDALLDEALTLAVEWGQEVERLASGTVEAAGVDLSNTTPEERLAITLSAGIAQTFHAKLREFVLADWESDPDSISRNAAKLVTVTF